MRIHSFLPPLISDRVEFANGDHFSIVRFDNGEVWTCGRNVDYECGLAEDHPATIDLKERKEAELKLKAGDIAKGLALARVDEYIPTFQRVFFPPKPTEANKKPELPPYDQPSDTKIVSIAAGPRHGLAVSAAGFVYSWGYSGTCQLGLGDEDCVQTPTRLASKDMAGQKFIKVAAGAQHSVFLAVKRTE